MPKVGGCFDMEESQPLAARARLDHKEGLMASNTVSARWKKAAERVGNSSTLLQRKDRQGLLSILVGGRCSRA